MKLRLPIALLTGWMAASAAPPPAPRPGIIQARTYHFAAAKKDLPFSLYVPKKFDRQKKYPLVVALHGLFSSHAQIIRYPGLVTQAEKHNWHRRRPTGL